MSWLTDTILSPRFWLGRQNHHKPLTEALTVTIVIPAWNEEDHIRETVIRCRAQSYPCNVLVVDDCSTDSTAQVARAAGAKVVSGISNQGSKARAINLIVDDLTTDLMIVVDADTALTPTAVEDLINAFSDPKVMVACGIVHARNYGTFWEKARHAEYICTQHIVKRAQGNARMLMVASGCFSAFRTEWLQEAGGFPERTMAEDMDLTWTAIKEGKRVAFVPGAHCYVTDPASWKVYRSQLMRWYRGFFQCIKVRKYWMGFNRLTIVAYAYILAAIVGALAVAAFFIFGIFEFVLAYFLLGIAIPFSVVMYHSIREGRSVWEITSAFACMVLCIPVNMGLLMYSLYLEVFRGNTLEVWEKGH